MRIPVREDARERLAQQAEATADRLHACLDDLKTLHARLLLHIEEIGGDRAHNWDLQADIARSIDAVYTASVKSRTVARHARQNNEDGQ